MELSKVVGFRFDTDYLGLSGNMLSKMTSLSPTVGASKIMDTFVTTDKVKTAVITGNHPYDVPAFHDMWRSFPEILFYPQTLDDFVSDAGAVRSQYDVLVFYNFHQEVQDP
ncbi:MAG TPA: hypothetical protein VGK81_09530, partial [Anaerolineae bacterium]